MSEPEPHVVGQCWCGGDVIATCVRSCGARSVRMRCIKCHKSFDHVSPEYTNPPSNTLLHRLWWSHRPNT